MTLTLPLSIAGFFGSAAVIGVCGVLLTGRAEHLARVTGLGQAIMGAVFIGATTSLAGLVTSATAAAQDHPALAVSNSLGGIAVQTVFLAVADIAYRRANLEHAAASEANLQQCALLIVLLAIPMLALATPDARIGWVHPASPALVVTYVLGVRLVSRAQREPMWRPRMTRETEREQTDRDGGQAATRDWLALALLATAVAAAGWVVAVCAIDLAERLGLQESLVGGVFTSLSTSLPELVIAVAAVRRGALTLAVGDILGGNAFDVLFLAVSDAVYRGGSLYAAVGRDEMLWVAVTVVMAAVLQMGLLRRERHGIANIGFESAAVLGVYAGTLVALVAA